MSSELVSVIIPNYNHEKFLKQRIETVLNQTYENIEVILLDDNSSDGSRRIIESYRADPKISNIIINKTNSGSVFKQWEKGIGIAKGCYIWIAESDDSADKNFLEELVAVHRQNKNIGIAYCNSYTIDGYGAISDITIGENNNIAMKTSVWKSSFFMNGESFLEDYLSRCCCINNVSAVLFEARALKESIVNIGEYRFAGDWAVYTNILLSKNIYYLNSPLSFYRNHQKNTSKKSEIDNIIYFERFEIISLYFNWFLRRGKSLNKYANSIKSQILPVVVAKEKRITIIKRYWEINSKLTALLILRLPGVFINLLITRIKK
ncbi:glycosyltransferase [Niabella hirudinis]|uniref:glycosyltransferase n=1 Tax=Niabella hirudinis TaxID=1285929 RepID=UPI003EBD16D4